MFPLSDDAYLPPRAKEYKLTRAFFTAEELFEAGYTQTDLRRAGFGDKDLRDAGYVKTKRPRAKWTYQTDGPGGETTDVSTLNGT